MSSSTANRELRSIAADVAADVAAEHGPSACGLAFRVKDAPRACQRALHLGAQPIDIPTGPMALCLPAIEGTGGAPPYLIDRFEDGRSINDIGIDIGFIDGVDRHPAGHGLKLVDHATHKVYRDRMAFEAFRMKFNGEGIQPVALRSDDPIPSIDSRQLAGVPPMSAPNGVDGKMPAERPPGHGQPVAELQTRGILRDGSTESGSTGAAPRLLLLLQTASAPVLGPVCFEFTQRQGDDGFGEGNFKAWFQSLERDQICRGALGVDNCKRSDPAGSAGACCRGRGLAWPESQSAARQGMAMEGQASA